MRRSFLIFGFILLLTACGHQVMYDHAPNTEQSVYRLGADDKINLRIFQEPELSGVYRIDSQGNMALPLVGEIKLLGMTEDEAAKAIADELRRRDYMRAPKVSVEMAEMRPVFVMGEVGKPGEFAYKSGLTVYQAVAMAGGYTYRADRDDIMIRRDMANRKINVQAVENTILLPGDVLEIGERYF